MARSYPVLLSSICAILFALMPTISSSEGSIQSVTVHSSALANLKAARDFIAAVHPGAVPGIDPTFRRQLDAGLEEALALAAHLPIHDQTRAALNAYTAGFADAHLAIAPPEKLVARPKWAGWTVVPLQDAYVVRDVAASWKTPLPPAGALLTHCNDEPINKFLQTRIAPYVDRRNGFEEVRLRLGAALTNRLEFLPLPISSVAHDCTFRHVDGSTLNLPIIWVETEEGLSRLQYARPDPRSEPWHAGYWVHANDFDPHSPHRVGFKKMVHAVAAIPPDAPFVVLDTRGNGGGSGIYGYELLSALLKNQMPRDKTDAHARWRVSDLLIDQLRSELTTYLARDPRSARVRTLSAVLASLVEAQAKGESFVDDILSTALFPAPPGDAFRGRLILITDSNCASACLDFVDLVRSVPGVLHVGRETSGDTHYLEIVRLPLPSGCTLIVPTKVWSRRGRGNNEPIKPHKEIAGDIRDTAGLRKWLADILNNHPQSK